MAGPIDRKPDSRERLSPAFPLAPLQVFCMSGLRPQVFDIRWSNPAELMGNGKFTLIGVNLYRSFGSEFGPYYRLNSIPIGNLFWRDSTRVKVALQEDVSNSFIAKGQFDSVDNTYMFKTNYHPIVIDQIIERSINMNVQVTVDGVQSIVDWVDPVNGTVRLSTEPTFNVISQKMIQPVLPNNNSRVLINYRYIDNNIPDTLAPLIFYRVTTVAVLPDGHMVETPLEQASQSNNTEIEKINYIWAEAIRRNQWILDQAGERVKVFIRRIAGQQCGCQSDLHGQPSSTCQTCYGTSIIGGYSGSYDIVLAPPDIEKSIKQESRGRTMSQAYETWTGPSPLLTQRDFIVKLNGERFGIGPVRITSNRGMQLQQTFQVSHLDESDIRYKVPIIDPMNFKYPETRYMIPGGDKATPMITNDPNIPSERQIRGTSPTSENQNR
jgi:hypothetical protein